mmetsp:Transcript_2806/g.7256  ORF Transcript_2806/g.7256 Transcript_2806/m.7256 type:complete len:85 (+) Transcript_2806:1-255(+)
MLEVNALQVAERWMTQAAAEMPRIRRQGRLYSSDVRDHWPRVQYCHGKIFRSAARSARKSLAKLQTQLQKMRATRVGDNTDQES